MLAAFGAALLFGASTPFAKLLLGASSPWVVAGLLYLGSGLGLAAYRFLTDQADVHLKRSDVGWLAGAILAGGVVAPVLLLFGLAHMPASGASLLLNAEGVLTAVLAWATGAAFPHAGVILGAGFVGFLGYGVSLTLFVIGLRHLGTARTGAYFSTAPFAGALLAVPLLCESLSVQIVTAAVLMGCGVYLHLTEHHDHIHCHEPLEHEHEHVHDEHHAHQHSPAVEGPHSHVHGHERLTHAHPHYPDAHHEHPHAGGTK